MKTTLTRGEITKFYDEINNLDDFEQITEIIDYCANWDRSNAYDIIKRTLWKGIKNKGVVEFRGWSFLTSSGFGNRIHSYTVDVEKLEKAFSILMRIVDDKMRAQKAAAKLVAEDISPNVLTGTTSTSSWQYSSASSGDTVYVYT